MARTSRTPSVTYEVQQLHKLRQSFRGRSTFRRRTQLLRLCPQRLRPKARRLFTRLRRRPSHPTSLAPGPPKRQRYSCRRRQYLTMYTRLWALS